MTIGGSKKQGHSMRAALLIKVVSREKITS